MTVPMFKKQKKEDISCFSLNKTNLNQTPLHYENKIFSLLMFVPFAATFAECLHHLQNESCSGNRKRTLITQLELVKRLL
jgi:hypothetical protein